MEMFQEFFVKALLALLFACVLAKLVVSVALYGGDKASDQVKVVEKQRNSNKKVLRISKSMKRVKFSDDVMVKHVSYKYEVEEERRYLDSEIRSVVNYDVRDDGSGSSGSSVKSMEIVEETRDKGEILKRVDDQRVIVKEPSEKGEIMKKFDDQRVTVKERSGIGKILKRVDDQRVIVEEGSGKGEILKRVDGVDEQRVIVEETSVKDEILKRVDQVEDQKAIVEVTSEKGEILKMVADQRVIAEEKSENGKKSTRVDQVEVEEENEKYENLLSVDQVEDQRMIIEEKGEKDEILKRVDQVEDQKVIVEEKSEILKRSDQVNEDNIKIDFNDEMVGVCSDDKEKVSVNLGSFDEALVKEVVNEKSDDVAIGLKEESGVPQLREEEEVVIDDDWEGIERTELEKRFGSVVNQVECGVKLKDDQLANLGSDVQIQLYALHKIAVEGPCHEPQPMALNFSARAKWNAWQKLGTMSRELAMEEYIKLLSQHSTTSVSDIQHKVISD